MGILPDIWREPSSHGSESATSHLLTQCSVPHDSKCVNKTMDTNTYFPPWSLASKTVSRSNTPILTFPHALPEINSQLYTNLLKIGILTANVILRQTVQLSWSEEEIYIRETIHTSSAKMYLFIFQSPVPSNVSAHQHFLNESVIVKLTQK